MKRFKFVSNYVSTNQIKDWLSPKTKALKIPFKLEDIQPGTFSKSVMKRLMSAKDGTRVIVRKGRGYWIAIEVVENRKENKKGLKKQVAAIKRRMTILTKTSDDLREMRELQSKLTNLEWQVKKL
jgi:hypothetical protein